MLVGGAGVGLAVSTLIAAGVTALPPQRSATGSAMINAGRQIASAVGVAVLVTLVGVHVDAAGRDEFRLAWLVAALLGASPEGWRWACPARTGPARSLRPLRLPLPAGRHRTSRSGPKLAAIMTAAGFALFDTAIGYCALGWTEAGIVDVNLPEADPDTTRRRIAHRLAGSREQPPPPAIGR